MADIVKYSSREKLVQPTILAVLALLQVINVEPGFSRENRTDNICETGTIEKQINSLKSLLTSIQNSKKSSTTLDNLDAYALFSFEKRAIIEQIIVTCGQNAVPTLARLLQVEQDTMVREVAVEALVKIGGPEATNALIATLKSDQNQIIRKSAAEALGKISGLEAINALITTLKSDQDQLIRKSAAEALQRIKTLDALAAILESDQEPSVRGRAVKALGDFANSSAINLLITILHNNHEPEELRSDAASALSAIGELAIDSLAKSLKSENLRTRYLAFAALANINTPNAVQLIKASQIEITQTLMNTEQTDLSDKFVGNTSKSLTYVFEAEKSGKINLPQKPLACSIDFIAKYWKRCH